MKTGQNYAIVRYVPSDYQPYPMYMGIDHCHQYFSLGPLIVPRVRGDLPQKAHLADVASNLAPKGRGIFNIILRSNHLLSIERPSMPAKKIERIPIHVAPREQFIAEKRAIVEEYEQRYEMSSSEMAALVDKDAIVPTIEVMTWYQA